MRVFPALTLGRKGFTVNEVGRVYCEKRARDPFMRRVIATWRQFVVIVAWQDVFMMNPTSTTQNTKRYPLLSEKWICRVVNHNTRRHNTAIFAPRRGVIPEARGLGSPRRFRTISFLWTFLSCFAALRRFNYSDRKFRFE